jgi:hypothetical protein
LRILDTEQNFSARLEWSRIVGNLPAGKWLCVKITLGRFTTASIHSLNPRSQGLADAAAHTLILDEITIDSSAERSPASNSAPPLAVPQNVQAKGYERHVDVTWQPSRDQNVARYVVYGSDDGQHFRPLAMQIRGLSRYSDFVGEVNQTKYYKVAVSDRLYRQSSLSAAAHAATREMTDDELLTMFFPTHQKRRWPLSSMTTATWVHLCGAFMVPSMRSTSTKIGTLLFTWA